MGKGGTEINYPAQQGYGESMRESLQAQIDLAPQLYGAEASQQYGRPAYAQLETDILRDTLLGQERVTPEGGDPIALRDLGAGGAGAGQPVSVAGGKYQTIYRPGRLFDDGKRQFSVDLIDPQTGEIVMSKTGEFMGDDLVGAGGVSEKSSQAIGQAMQSLFGQAKEQGLMTAPEATQAVQQFQQVGTEAGAVWSGYAGESGDPGQMDAWRDRFRAGDPEVVGAVTELGGDPNMSDDELARFHYDKFGGRDAGFAPPPGAGSVARSEGLLDILSGTQTGRFGTGEVVESATQPGVTPIGMEERRAGYDPTGKTLLGLATYGSDIAEQAARRTRAADIGDVSRFAGVTREAMEAADPLSAGLLGAEKWGLGAQAQEGLEAGRGLSPRQRREAEQAARAGWEARGLIRDPEAVVSEVESVMEAGGAEEAKRRAFAQNVMGVSQAMTADPFMAILGRPSGASQQIAQQGLGSAGYGLTSGPQQYSPEAGLSYMLRQQTNQANLAAAQQAAAATRSAGLMSGLGQAASAIPWCWIAREVYGESNPKWVLFREWLLNKAPEWFKLWYLINGEQVAAWLKDKPEMKARIRLFMDSKVGA